jgi:UPF0755 protein
MRLAKVFKRVALLLLVAVLGAAGVAQLVWTRLQAPYKGYASADTFVDIPRGVGTSGVATRLADAGVVRDAWLVRIAVWWSGTGRGLKAGEYRFDHALSPLDVVGVLARGEVYEHRLTFPEGLTITEMGALYEMHGFGRAADFAAAAREASLVADLDSHASDLEGYLFPETYALPRTATATQLVHQMVDRFKTVFGPELRQKAAAQGLSARQVVTLASVIEKETARAEERALVSAVYRNRLTQGMALQADPTVVYALERAHRYDGNIHRADLQFDSPYNTYRYPGLPPGPIASPGQASLEAALAPADVRFVYFVSRNDGTHAFATTLAQHNANVRTFQVEFFRQRRLAARAAR